MNVTWLGQAGLLIKKNEFKIMVDPYLSNSCYEINPNHNRRVEVKEELFSEMPDMIIITHNHLDHMDPETLKKLLNTKKSITVLAPYEAWNEVRKFGGTHNYVMFNRGTQWSQNGFLLKAVKAEHSDLSAIGVIINDGILKFYITGDTLYNDQIFDDIKEEIDVLFLPINGVGNNMNAEDAARFARRIGAKKTVPLHWGLFDNINPAVFDCPNVVIPDFYKEINVTEE